MAALIRSLARTCCYPFAVLVACQSPRAPTPPSAPTDSDTADTVPDTRPGIPCEEPTDRVWTYTYVWNESLNEEACLSSSDEWCTYVPQELGGGQPECPSLDCVLTASGFLTGDPISYDNNAYGCVQDGQNYVVFYHERQYDETAGQHWLVFDDAGIMVAYAIEVDVLYEEEWCCDGRETEWFLYGEVVWPRCEDPVSYGPEDFR